MVDYVCSKASHQIHGLPPLSPTSSTRRPANGDRPSSLIRRGSSFPYRATEMRSAIGDRRSALVLRNFEMPLCLPYLLYLTLLTRTESDFRDQVLALEERRSTVDRLEEGGWKEEGGRESPNPVMLTLLTHLLILERRETGNG